MAAARPSLTAQGLVHQQIVAEKASSSSLRPNLDPVKAVGGPRFAAVIERCWHSEPAERPSASQLVDELEVPPPPPTPPANTLHSYECS